MLVVSLLVASFVIFSAIFLAPGNPIAALSGGRSLPPESLRTLEVRYHLDQPFLVQYWYWLSNAVHGNLGLSITLRENVSDLIASRISTTAGLVLYASILIIVLGVSLGILPARLPSPLRRGATFASSASRPGITPSGIRRADGNSGASARSRRGWGRVSNSSRRSARSAGERS